MLTFEIYQDDEGQFRWRLRALNGEIIAGGEGYVSRADCVHAIDLLQQGAATASIKDST